MRTEMAKFKCGDFQAVIVGYFILPAFQNREFGNAKPDPELFFRDGVRKIDFVLAYEDENGGGGRRLSVFGDTGHSLASLLHL